MFARSALVECFSLRVCLPEETKVVQSFASFILTASSAYILLSHCILLLRNGAAQSSLIYLFTYLFTSVFFNLMGNNTSTIFSYLKITSEIMY